MLVLGRLQGQSIRIGSDISVQVNHVDLVTGYVKLGFIAPDDVIIDREEIYQRKKSGAPNIPKYLSEDDAKCLLRHNTKS